MNYNRLHNLDNPYQGDTKRVLCVCSAGLLRSPTAAIVLAGEPFNFNTRAAGLDESYALIPVDDALLIWADEIVCMDSDQKRRIETKLAALRSITIETPVVNLNIEDSYSYRDPRLIERIHNTYTIWNNERTE